jgi:predicted transcriptional regulator
MAFEINRTDIETGAKSSETSNAISGYKKELFTLAIMLAPTMFASAQTTGPEKKPEDKKPATEQVNTWVVNPTDSNKVIKPRTRDLNGSAKELVDAQAQELATEKQELATEKQELATEKQELATKKNQEATTKKEANESKYVANLLSGKK